MKWTNSYRSFGLKTKRSTGLKTIEHKHGKRPQSRPARIQAQVLPAIGKDARRRSSGSPSPRSRTRPAGRRSLFRPALNRFCRHRAPTGRIRLDSAHTALLFRRPMSVLLPVSPFTAFHPKVAFTRAATAQEHNSFGTSWLYGLLSRNPPIPLR